MENAVKKLQDEISSSNKNPYVKVVGEFLIQHIQANPSEASKIMVADKTIAKSIEAISAAARKKAVNGMAMLTDAEGFAIVLKYFGISGRVAVKAAPEVAKEILPDRPSDKPSFSLSLDDVLGGL